MSRTAHGNQVRTAHALAVSRATLIDEIRRYGIRRQSVVEEP